MYNTIGINAQEETALTRMDNVALTDMLKYK
jgi:hypothetical protein